MWGGRDEHSPAGDTGRVAIPAVLADPDARPGDHVGGVRNAGRQVRRGWFGTYPDAGCQWGIFLRNHDGLTLEMVTDDERDYMYSEYAKDPRMKANIGIRRGVGAYGLHSGRSGGRPGRLGSMNRHQHVQPGVRYA